MNKTRIRELADAIKGNKFIHLDFNMQVISEPKNTGCGSMGCILGYALAAKAGGKPRFVDMNCATYVEDPLKPGRDMQKTLLAAPHRGSRILRHFRPAGRRTILPRLLQGRNRLLQLC